ncbi:MAG: DUF2183 domain-containing protein, partial [Anaerolineae bacterium]|nr:DUF2183 domain-containing protein [Anaerolineae bacterium]
AVFARELLQTRVRSLDLNVPLESAHNPLFLAILNIEVTTTKDHNMASVPRWVKRAAHNLDNQFDKVAEKLHRLSGDNSRIHITPYMGYGNREKVHLRGRAFRRYNVPFATETDSRWMNLRNLVRRFVTHEFANASVRIDYAGETYETTTDDEGYIHLTVEPPEAAETFTDATYTLQVAAADRQHTAPVLVVPDNASFAVISDIDDTILQTEVTKLLNMIRNTLFHNALTRMPLPGVAAFYRALQRGTTEDGFNPVYYVSNGVWNMHDLLTHFFQIRGIPRGPLFLRDAGITEDIFGVDVDHKINAIRHLMTLHPDLPFILIGDSGEKDAMIYAEVVREFPGRIPAVYIRDVDPEGQGSKRDFRVLALVDELKNYGTDILLISDTIAAAKDAIARGYLPPESLPAIVEATERDIIG